MASKPRLVLPPTQTNLTKPTRQQDQPLLQGTPSSPLIPPIEVPYEDPFEQRNARLQVQWSEWMQGAQRNKSIYKNVEVLLISWNEESDDLGVQEEVKNLSDIFKNQYHYNVTEFQLDRNSQTRPQTEVNFQVAKFAKENDGELTLLIVYYAGHGSPGKSPGQLKLTGQSNPSSQDPYHIVWNYTEGILQGTFADVLVIFDCCYAGDLGPYRAGRSSRSFEYLGATSSYSTTPIPGKTSFTSALVWALEIFAGGEIPQKFTMTELLNKIKEAPHFPRHQQPVLISRNEECAQRIILSALEHTGQQDQVKEDPIPVDPECLELRLFFDPGPRDSDLRDLAKALTRHMGAYQDPHGGGLYRVSIGKLYSLRHNYASRWLQHKRSGHLRQNSSSSGTPTNHQSPQLTIPATESLKQDHHGPYRTTVEADSYQTATEVDTSDNIGGQQEVQHSIIQLLKMLAYAIWIATMAVLRPANDQQGHLRLL